MPTTASVAPRQPDNEVTGEGNGGGHRSWGEHRHGHSMEIMPLEKPVKLTHDAYIEERHDAQAAAVGRTLIQDGA
jgi:hypothetical protein